jgi:hypothetical protein
MSGTTLTWYGDDFEEAEVLSAGHAFQTRTDWHRRVHPARRSHAVRAGSGHARVHDISHHEPCSPDVEHIGSLVSDRVRTDALNSVAESRKIGEISLADFYFETDRCRRQERAKLRGTPNSFCGSGSYRSPCFLWVKGDSSRRTQCFLHFYPDHVGSDQGTYLRNDRVVAGDKGNGHAKVPRESGIHAILADLHSAQTYSPDDIDEGVRQYGGWCAGASMVAGKQDGAERAVQSF